MARGACKKQGVSMTCIQRWQQIHDNALSSTLPLCCRKKFIQCYVWIQNYGEIDGFDHADQRHLREHA